MFYRACFYRRFCGELVDDYVNKLHRIIRISVLNCEENNQWQYQLPRRGNCPACERPFRTITEVAESYVNVIMRDQMCVPACVRRLDSNALVCDCGMMWLSDMLKDGHLQAAVTCDQPSSMAGQSLVSVLDDIVCRESHTSRVRSTCFWFIRRT